MDFSPSGRSSSSTRPIGRSRRRRPGDRSGDAGDVAARAIALPRSEIEAALTAATTAQAAWKRLDAKTRAKYLHAVANAIEAPTSPAAPS